MCIYLHNGYCLFTDDEAESVFLHVPSRNEKPKRERSRNIKSHE